MYSCATLSYADAVRSLDALAGHTAERVVKGLLGKLEATVHSHIVFKCNERDTARAPSMAGGDHSQ